MRWLFIFKFGWVLSLLLRRVWPWHAFWVSNRGSSRRSCWWGRRLRRWRERFGGPSGWLRMGWKRRSLSLPPRAGWTLSQRSSPSTTMPNSLESYTISPPLTPTVSCHQQKSQNNSPSPRLRTLMLATGLEIESLCLTWGWSLGIWNRLYQLGWWLIWPICWGWNTIGWIRWRLRCGFARFSVGGIEVGWWRSCGPASWGWASGLCTCGSLSCFIVFAFEVIIILKNFCFFSFPFIIYIIYTFQANCIFYNWFTK